MRVNGRISSRSSGWHFHPGLPCIGLLAAVVALLSSCGDDPVFLFDDRRDLRPQWLANGDVEAATASSPEAWDNVVGQDPSAVYDFEWSSTTARSGQRSLKITHATADPSFGSWSQAVDVSNLTGTELTATAWVKLEGVSGNGFALALRVEGSGGVLASVTTAQRGPTDHNTGTGDWREFKIAIESVPEGVDRVVVTPLLASQSAGTVYIDDIVLSSTTGGGLALTLQNGNLEFGNAANTKPLVWFGFAPPGYEQAWTTQEAASPGHSLLLSATAPQTPDSAFWIGRFGASDFVGRPVTVSVSLKLDDVQGQGVSIALRGDAGPVADIIPEVYVSTAGNLSLVGTQDWQGVSLTLLNVPANIDLLSVLLIYLPGTTGTAYFDDIFTR